MRRAWVGLKQRSQTANPVICGRKFCTDCGRWRPISDFARVHHRRYGWRADSYCQTCRRIAVRRRYQQMTPAQRALRYEYARIWGDVQRRRAGKPRRPHIARRPLPDGDEGRFFDAAPLAAELEQTDIDQWALAELAGVPSRAIYRITSGEVERVQLDTADRLALALGLSMAELWGVDD